MKERIDFRSITLKIKKECLGFGYGTIRFDKDKEDLWIDDYENLRAVSVHVDAIKIDYEEIELYEDNRLMLIFDEIFSIDRQIQIYETIYSYQDQLRYFKFDWSDYFKALQVEDETGGIVWSS